MRNEYSEPLYNLYKEARQFLDKFRPIVEDLIEGEDAFDPFVENFIDRYSVGIQQRNNIRTYKTDPKLFNAHEQLARASEEFYSNVLAILSKISQISFRMRFDEPKGGLSIQTQYYTLYTFSKDMEDFLDKYDDFSWKVDELFDIIGDYEKSIYQPSDFTEKLPKDDINEKDIAYRFRYDTIQGKLYVNDIEVGKCNLDSQFDRALSQAIETPNTPIKTKSNLASAIASIKLPKDLKKLMFRTSKNSFMLKPVVIFSDIKDAGLDIDRLNQEFQKL